MAAFRLWRRRKTNVDDLIFALELEHKQVRELLAGPGDARDALEEYLEDLTTTLKSLKLARKLARNIPQDIEPDAETQEPILLDARDPGVSQLDPGAATSAPRQHSSSKARKGKEPLADPLGSPSSSRQEDQPPSSARWTAAGPESPHQAECVVCNDSFPAEEGKGAPCGHFYCRDCLNRLCLVALEDRNLIPVQCCKKDFPEEWLREVFNKKQWRKYARILAGMSPQEIAGRLDPAYQRWADENKCKLCPKCGCAIERTDGCNHMTCSRCKHQFCYACGTAWACPRKCRCPLFPPEELEGLLGPGAFQPPRWLARILRWEVARP